MKKLFFISTFTSLAVVLYPFIDIQLMQNNLSAKATNKSTIRIRISYYNPPIFDAPVIQEEEIVHPEPVNFYFEQTPIDTLLPEVSIINDHYYCGCQPAPLQIIEIPLDTSKQELNDYSIFAEPIFINPDLFEAKAYPNPTISSAQVAVDVKDEGIYNISLYNMNGQLIRSIHNGELFVGRQLFDLELNDQNSGMYIVTITSQTQTETLKIQKVN